MRGARILAALSAAFLPAALPPRAREREGAAGSGGPRAVFFAIHLEAGELTRGRRQEEQWPNAVGLVGMADRYGAKLTLMFNPQWAEHLLAREDRLKAVRAWQKNGHEIAVHYHNVFHGDWNGYTNRKDEKYVRDPRYRGTVKEMMDLLSRLAGPERPLTMCMGPDALWDSLDAVEIDGPDYPEGVVYDVDGMNAGLSPLLRTRFAGREILHLKHRFFAPQAGRREHLEKLKEEFSRARSHEVVGAVTHEADFGRSPGFIEQWFRFCREKGAPIRTVRDIVESYPRDKAVDVKAVAQAGGPAPKNSLPDKVRRFHDLLRARKAEGTDTREAEELDLKSREAARAGDPGEAERLLEKAIEKLVPR